MKKLLIVMALAMLLCTAAAHATPPAGESHGSTIVTTMVSNAANSSKYNICQLLVSNITESEVECTIRFYAHDGTDVADQAEIFTGTHSGSQPAIGTGPTFSIPANSSRVIQFHKAFQRTLLGYAVLDWKSSNTKLTKALVGTVRHYSVGGVASGFFPINGGQPF